MKYISIIIILASGLFASWTEVSPDSVHATMQPDSTGVSVVDSSATFSADTVNSGRVRVAEIVYFKDDTPILFQEIGYCTPPDSTRRFFARCMENERWFRWEE